jgi:CBS domain containing-hemolysin-like protein
MFSAGEMAFSTANRIRLRSLSDDGNKKAKTAVKLIEHYDKTLTTILVGNNIVNILSASIATAVFAKAFGAAGIGIATALMTVVVLVFGEVIPKTYAKYRAETLALALADVLFLLVILFTPIVFLFGILQKFVIILSSKNKKNHPSVTEDELKIIINEIEDEGVLEEQESRLVRSALEFDDITVDKIFIPRTKMTAVSKDWSVEKIKQLFADDRYSRLPVYDGSVDNIIGIIYEKDFFAKFLGGEDLDDFSGIIKNALYVTEFDRISEVLPKMQKTKIHMAIVKDQYGGTSGIVTLEDIIEELVGEIYDENDEIIPSVVKISENEYEIAPDLNIGDFEEQLGLPAEYIQTEANTVGGWAMEILGEIPEIGDSAVFGCLKLTVTDSDKQKINKIKVTVDDTFSEIAEN